MKSIQQLTDQLKALSVATRARDEYTAEHSDRTCALALGLGESCGLDSRDLALLRIAATFHDLGKIGIPDRVLLKPGRFDAGEWEIMRTHSDCGYRILSSIQAEHADTIATAVRHHHESFDGNGYPAGLSGERIPLLSRIVSLADCYDAMAATRPYHAPKSHQSIMRILHEENATNFDPYLRNKFSDFIESSPFKAASGES
jgi:HD-GYP domain-containing protein (c-di-GMP phosphodiesterase class II)